MKIDEKRVPQDGRFNYKNTEEEIDLRVSTLPTMFGESIVLRILDRKRYVENLSEFIADKRITIEVCLTSNQQTVPELSADLRRHPFGEMRRRRLSTTFCTDNRLVSHTTVSHEIARAVEAFALTPQEVRDSLIYGFKRSFYPGTYLEKRAYVRQAINFANRLLVDAGHGPFGPSPT